MTTTQRTSEQIRNEFFDFFREKGHEVVPSDSLVPHGDATLLFTNAGMNQFKDVFLGTGDRPYVRAANTQKCLRVSGKHNDLEEVGVDTYHHTFFEMLGNWSFGDYFKEEAIAWAWELLVERWGLAPDRLYATVHAGDEKLGLGSDDEAAGFWRSETDIHPEHILYFGSKDNFWMMGDTGPCGPCSEIHVDLRSDAERKKQPGRDLVNADDPRVMEIWNLVFIQYNALADGSIEPLPAQHVDTGMGFERLVAVLQGRKSNYDTDLFDPLLAAVAELSPRSDVQSYDDIDADDSESERVRVAMRVVADHVRTLAFAIADGVIPGNVGRGYVIRRILRRAVRFGYQTLDLRTPFLYRLVRPLAEKMSASFPEVEDKRSYVERVIRAEEEGFLATLGTGLAFFENITPYLHDLSDEKVDSRSLVKKLSSDRKTMDLLQKAYGPKEDRNSVIRFFTDSARKGVVPGEVAFLLHDTYGFPVDLTQLMAREEGFAVEMEAYDRLMDEQRDKAKSAANFVAGGGGSGSWVSVSPGEESEFLGYEHDAADEVLIRRVRTLQAVDESEVYQVILDRTPFYAESGGQIGDTGLLVVGDQELKVLDTQRINGDIVHMVDRLPTELDVPVMAMIDTERRRRIKKHHTATHLLHAALRRILGTHVSQKGSLVAPDHLRFDFSHFERLTPDQLQSVARLVNEKVQQNIEKTEERGVALEDALARGAMALFGEKYGDSVRVITFDPEYSVELCGGTHVNATGEIGLFSFRSEGSVAAGIRRVEAVVGLDALSFVEGRLEELDRVRGQFKTVQRPTDEEVADLIDQNKRLAKELDRLRTENLSSRLADFLEGAARANGVRVATGDVGKADMETLRQLGQRLREMAGSETVGVLGAVDPEGEKVYLVACVTDDVISSYGLEAGEIVGPLAKLVGGGGGGRPELATAGGKNPEMLPSALAEAAGIVAAKMESA